jgi:hypothetical protein
MIIRPQQVGSSKATKTLFKHDRHALKKEQIQKAGKGEAAFNPSPDTTSEEAIRKIKREYIRVHRLSPANALIWEQNFNAQNKTNDLLKDDPAPEPDEIIDDMFYVEK